MWKRTRQFSAAKKFEQKVAKFLKTQKTYIKAVKISQTYINGLEKVENIYISTSKNYPKN